MTRFLHVANGTSTTATIHRAGLPGRSSIWADALHDGPVPGGIADADLLAVRALYLARTFRTSHEETIAELHRWRDAIASVDSYDELVLWYEHDLFDQLNLIQVLNWIAGLPSTPRVSLISIGAFPGRERFKGLGELSPDELAPLFDTRQPLTYAQYGLAERAWHAFRSSDPRSIETVVAGDTSPLPFLADALRRHLEEFPWIGDGLSRTERRLLELLAPGPLDLRIAFPRMHDLETHFYIADASFLDLVSTLASAPAALLALAPSPPEARELEDVASLTEHGRSVLTGGIDRVARWGVDRWLGGVHLEGMRDVWRWHPGEQRLVSA